MKVQWQVKANEARAGRNRAVEAGGDQLKAERDILKEPRPSDNIGAAQYAATCH